MLWQDFAALSYSDAKQLVIGNRKLDEFWLGNLTNLTVRSGVHPNKSSIPTPTPAPAPIPAGGKLDPTELQALKTLHDELGGLHFQYRAGTDVYHDPNGVQCQQLGNRSRPCACGQCKGKGGRWLAGTNPCSWFGVQCDAAGQHVTGLFPNPRTSGNPLVGQLPSAISKLRKLEHFYSSNDVSKSRLSGSFPPEFGSLKSLKCMYFSHNEIR